MNFLSLSFFCFFIVLQILYYTFPNKAQNLILVMANYIFYLWSTPIFGVYLLFSTVVCYFCARGISKEKYKKLLLLVSIVICFGQLCWFKYLPWSLGMAQPLGISFYTFCLTSYVFDVYYGKYDAEKNFILFLAFSSFFPSLLSGPINRGDLLIPQLKTHRIFDSYGWKKGFWRFLKGTAKKLMISAPLGLVVDSVYSAQYEYGPLMWIMIAIAYAIYIYADFASYSDMAIGVAYMLGIKLNENFRAPYLSIDVKTFWKKWHISLTSWFREYIYFPLGGSKKGKVRTYINILIVFVISGIWHGDGLTFIIWGLLNGLFQIAGSLTMPTRKMIREKLNISEENKLMLISRGVVTFSLISVTWIFFRATDINQAIFVCKRILLIFKEGPGEFVWLINYREFIVLFMAVFVMFIEDVFITLKRSLGIEKTDIRYWLSCSTLMILIFLFGNYGTGFNAQDFVYFQF